MQFDQSFDLIQNLSILKISLKQKCSGDKWGSWKRFKSNSQKFKLSQQYKAMKESSKPAINLYESDDDKYSNCVFEYLAITSADQVLSEFVQSLDFRKSVSSVIKELLTAL